VLYSLLINPNTKQKGSESQRKDGFMKQKTALVSLAVTTIAITAFHGMAQSPVKVSYWLWDSNQQPAYTSCAKKFMDENPGIKINITQKDWGDYWTKLNSSLEDGTAPDMFTNHLSKYPEYAFKKQIMNIAPLIKRDRVKTDIYLQGLYQLWGRVGQYGLPKDWDTIAIVYNKDLLRKAGVSLSQVHSMTWNPKNGGGFEEMAAKLTVDEFGEHGDSPRFNKAKVKQWGFTSFPDGNNGGAYGQMQWSHFAVSNGFKFNSGPWATKYNYDDPKLAETLQWLADMSLKKGYTPALATIKEKRGDALFAEGKVAMVFDGSWMISSYKKNATFNIGFAPLPIGPKGRKSMFNGLADSIWTGSKHKEEAWKWMKFMGSRACQDIVAGYGVVFPAIPGSLGKTMKSYDSKGLFVGAFIDQATGSDTTFLFPITDNAKGIDQVMSEAMDKILSGEEPASSVLKEANSKVNALFK
jgi:multiple sugar transport system substrate-binding protein